MVLGSLSCQWFTHPARHGTQKLVLAFFLAWSELVLLRELVLRVQEGLGVWEEVPFLGSAEADPPPSKTSLFHHNFGVSLS